MDEHGAAIVFESIADAERYLEPIDVQNGEYVAYDSEGRLLKLVPASPRISIENAELEPHHTVEVRNVLMRLLSYAGVPKEILEESNLETLVFKSLEYKTK